MSLEWEILEGDCPILLVAAHNFPHVREGVMKRKDVGTGRLVKELSEQWKCWGIWTNEIMNDPNWYVDSPFRQEVKQIVKQQGIKVVIDVHGRKAIHPFLVEFYVNKQFSNNYLEVLKGQEVRKFKDDLQLTVCEDLELEGVAGVQLEIRLDGRVGNLDPDNYLECRRILNNMVEELKTISANGREREFGVPLVRHE